MVRNNLLIANYGKAKRMNVALTRAQHGLIIVGNLKTI